VKLAKQRQTKIWWDRLSDWDCFLSPLVRLEIARGNPEAAARQQEKIKVLQELPISPEAKGLANLLVARKLVPESAEPDALHLALAAFHRADYLLTWNQTHLDNLELRSRIAELIRGWGLIPAKVITPERLLEEPI
jgi:predicted nucleic acid-binding protein